MTHKGRVSPFGHLRINGCSHLPEAFRRVPRPSSPLDAKAFTKCPLTLARNSVMHRRSPLLQRGETLRCRASRPKRDGPCDAACTRRPLFQIRYADNALPPLVQRDGAFPRLGRNVFTMIKSDMPNGLPSGIQVSRAPNDRGLSRVLRFASNDAAISTLQVSLVELTGFEPVTSCLQSRRSPS